MEPATDDLRRVAVEAGAAQFGVATAQPFDQAAETLRRHKAAGLSGPLHFTYDDPATATDIRASFPWAESLVVVGVEYASRANGPDKTGPVVARFATADHYRAVEAAAESVARALEGSGARAEVIWDDNRLVDRAAAARAGLGWIGRSSMVLAPGVGPWMLFGTVVTDARLETTPAMKRDCGTCIACVPACPTRAITPIGLDARRCLSTWLQTSGFMPLWVRPLVGRRIYGCDECLTSCPPGMRLISTVTPSGLSFAGLLALSDAELVELFSWWFIPHRNGRYLRRNLLVAGGNSGEAGVLSQIEAHLTHRSSMIRSHAAWALARHGPDWAEHRLREALGVETVPEPSAELAIALTMLTSQSDYQALLAADELSRTHSVQTGDATRATKPAGTD